MLRQELQVHLVVMLLLLVFSLKKNQVKEKLQHLVTIILLHLKLKRKKLVYMQKVSMEMPFQMK